MGLTNTSCQECGKSLPWPPPSNCPNCAAPFDRAGARRTKPRAPRPKTNWRKLAVPLAIVGVLLAVGVVEKLTTKPTPLTAAERQYVSDVRHDVNTGPASDRKLVSVGRSICKTYAVYSEDDADALLARTDFGVNGTALIAGIAQRELC